MIINKIYEYLIFCRCSFFPSWSGQGLINTPVKRGFCNIIMFLSGLIAWMNTTHTFSEYWEKVRSRTKQLETRGQIKKSGVLKMFSNSKFLKLFTFQGRLSICSLLSSLI